MIINQSLPSAIHAKLNPVVLEIDSLLWLRLSLRDVLFWIISTIF